MAESSAETGTAAGFGKYELKGALQNVDRYLLCSSLFLDAFNIAEKRGVFWWSLHKLLEDPEAPVSFRDLSDFLKSTANDYTSHQMKMALVTMQGKSYVSLFDEDDEAEEKGQDDELRETGVPPVLSRAEINNRTMIKLEKGFYEALEKYGKLFRERMIAGPMIGTDNLDVYCRLNDLFRIKYVNEWRALVGQIASLGIYRGAKNRLHIEQELGRYGNHWVIIKFLWRQCLRAESENVAPFLSTDQIRHELRDITFVPERDIGRILSLLRKATFIEKGPTRHSYRIAKAFHPMMVEFTRKTITMFDEFLAEIATKDPSN